MRLWRNQVDASDLKSDVRKGVPVRSRSVVPRMNASVIKSGYNSRLIIGPSGFESRRRHQVFRRVGWMVRHRIANPTLRNGRVGSTPTLSAKIVFFNKETK